MAREKFNERSGETAAGVTRREALAAGTAAVSASLAADAAARPAVSPPPIGVSTLGFGSYTNAELAEEFAAQGIKLTQLFLIQKDSRYWRYNGRTNVAELSERRCRQIADAYRSRGIAIDSIGVYTNLIHPDADERAANLAYFEDMMKVAKAMGVSKLVTESGYYEPEGPVQRTPYYLQRKVWYRAIDTFRRLAELAERHEATVLIEPFFGDLFASAKRTRCFIEEVGSARIRALLDAANLLEINDLEEMFGQLKPYIQCIHAKDRKLHAERGVPAGEGDIDYPKFMRLAMSETPGVPVILEYVGPQNYKKSLRYVRDAVRKAMAGA